VAAASNVVTSPEVRGLDMHSVKQRKVAKVSHKRSHGDSTRSVGLKNRGVVLKSVYKRLENRPVLSPVVRPDTDGRVLLAAVRAVVDPEK
jgi:hypothetical protein